MAARGGTVLYEGRRIAITADGFAIGRRSSNDLVIENDLCSRHHARIEVANGGFRIVDLGSQNGTYLNGERLSGTTRLLRDGDTIQVAGQRLNFLVGEETTFGSPVQPPAVSEAIRIGGERLSIGRDRSNDLVLDDPNVSRFHAEICKAGELFEIRDLGSTNGTRLDGRLEARATLEPGGEIGVGSHRLLFDGETFVARDDHSGLVLAAHGLTKFAGGQRILSEVSLAIDPGEFVAIIGESGAGKTTLLKSLAGVLKPDVGEVRINGDPVRLRLAELGYVPQDEIVHRWLTVEEALRFGAQLRLPEDARRHEVDEAVRRVLGELGLTHRLSARIDRLSGGERKRVGVASELLNRPGLLFLDEPTTGLDPGLERRSMELFHNLAGGGRAVVLVTHATRSLELCDRIVVMGSGGVLCFDGTPRAALEFFDVGHYDEIYEELEAGSGEWSARFAEGVRPEDETRAEAPVPRPAHARPARRLLPQAAVLVNRYVRLLWRDRRNVLILLAQVPVLALAIASLYSSSPFTKYDGAQQAAQLLFLVVTTAIWFGAIDAAREVIKERGVLDRERAIGLRLDAYLFSKASVLFALSAVQTLLMALIVFALRPLGVSTGTVLGLLGVLVMTSWVAVGMGLAISASVKTEDQATSFIPLALLPQLLFAGAIVSTAQMGRVAEWISDLMFARWSYAGIGAQLHMNSRIAGDTQFARVSAYGHDFFTVPLLSTGLILLAFLVAMFAGAWVLLKRGE
jgi:ABC-type multidrug transport system ATPase subunit/pSer/pThr/pTyr-binding forkhead associated (FHA) protein